MNNILLVDDMSTNRKLVSSFLKLSIQNINIIEAIDGVDALKKVYSNKIHVIILDIMMPNKDGMQVLQELKQSKEYQDIPVIMFSALSEIDYVEKALKMGALDYFTKPLSHEQMMITIPLKIKNALEYYYQKSELLKFNEHIKNELYLAEKVQKSMIKEYQKYDFAKIWGKYLPCNKIGGDVFSSKEFNNELWFIMADVSGHGISAALISAMLNVLFTTFTSICTKPSELLQKINETFYEIFNIDNNGFISAFVGKISNNTLYYSNAGHPYPIYISCNKNITKELSLNGFLIGILKDSKYLDESIDFHENDCLLLYTDGIFYKGFNNDYANWAQVLEFCSDNKNKLTFNTENALKSMIEHFKNFNSEEFIDDVALMFIKCTK